MRKSASELRVAILGAGPSAAFAVTACRQLDVGTIDIYTKEWGVPPNGSFFLHELPPHLPGPLPLNVVTFGIGGRDTYVRKQYPYTVNVAKEITSSFPEKGFVKSYYNYEQYWPKLMTGYNQLKTGVAFNSDEEISNLTQNGNYDIAFHSFPSFASRLSQPRTIPFKILTFDLRSPFSYSTKWNQFCDIIAVTPSQLSGWIQEVLGIWPFARWPNQPGWVLYNGKFTHPWVRMSYLWGVIHVEYPPDYTFGGWSKGILNSIAKVTFPQNLNPHTKPWITPIADNIYPIGRFAKWNRKVLSHHSYSSVYGIIKTYITEK